MPCSATTPPPSSTDSLNIGHLNDKILYVRPSCSFAYNTYSSYLPPTIGTVLFSSFSFKYSYTVNVTA